MGRQEGTRMEDSLFWYRFTGGKSVACIRRHSDLRFVIQRLSSPIQENIGPEVCLVATTLIWINTSKRSSFEPTWTYAQKPMRDMKLWMSIICPGGNFFQNDVICLDSSHQLELEPIFHPSCNVSVRPLVVITLCLVLSLASPINRHRIPNSMDQPFYLLF